MAIIDFTIHIDNPVDVSAIFDRIQVWRSPDQTGSPTAYVEITANEPTPATQDGTVSAPWAISGDVMTVILNGADSTNLTFTGSNPLTLTQVMSQINAQYPSIATEVPTDTGRIRLTSGITGTQSILQVSGLAATTIGFVGDHLNGKGARLLISPNTEDYLFRDFDGLNSYWYKSRYYSSVTGAVSDFSAPQLGGAGAALSGALVVNAKVALADLTGAPIVGKRVVFVPVSAQVVADGSGNNYGVFPSAFRVELSTDLNGRGSVTLVVGQRLKVFIEGTTFQREFIVPNADFDVLTVASTQPDPLSIVVAPPMPIRLS
jgi:hypothetical protein